MLVPGITSVCNIHSAEQNASTPWCVGVFAYHSATRVGDPLYRPQQVGMHIIKHVIFAYGYQPYRTVNIISICYISICVAVFFVSAEVITYSVFIAPVLPDIFI